MKLSLTAKIYTADLQDEVVNYFRKDFRFIVQEDHWPPYFYKYYLINLKEFHEELYCNLSIRDREASEYAPQGQPPPTGDLLVNFDWRNHGLLVDQLKLEITNLVKEINNGNYSLIKDLAENFVAINQIAIKVGELPEDTE